MPCWFVYLFFIDYYRYTEVQRLDFAFNVLSYVNTTFYYILCFLG